MIIVAFIVIIEIIADVSIASSSNYSTSPFGFLIFLEFIIDLVLVWKAFG